MKSTQITQKHAVLALAAAILSSSACAAQQKADPAAATSGDAELEGNGASSAYRAILEASYSEDAPGGAVIVTRGDQVIYRDAVGMANLELGVPLEADMVFRLGSITKQFTAAAVLLLVEDGKVALDDPLSKFIPDYPRGDDVTVTHLLNHTSGIQSYTDMPGYMSGPVRLDLSLDELIARFKDEPMQFEPGTEWRYNNSGYILLGKIIEVASGQSYDSFLKQRIFEPLGLEHTHFGWDAPIIPNRVSGYDPGENGVRNAGLLSMHQPHAAGSLLGTVDDLNRWTRALMAGKLVSDAHVTQMSTPTPLPDRDEPAAYGFGLIPSDVRGRQAITHGGGIFGFRTNAVYLPEEDVFVAVLSNNAAAKRSPAMVSYLLAALAIDDPFPKREPIELPTEKLERFTGVYRIDPETTRSVYVVDGALYTRREPGGGETRAFAANETRFFYEGLLSYFEFELDDTGKVRGMNMYQGGSAKPEYAELTDEEVERTAEVELPAELLAEYVGTYELQPGFALTVRLEEGRIVAQATGQGAIELKAKARDVLFSAQIGAEIHFNRSDNGAVVSLTLHQGGQVLEGKRLD